MSPLRITHFRNLWLGQAISQLGDSFYFVIFAFMVYQITQSSTMVGIVSALETVPYLFLGAYAGVLADRIDRRRIMLASDLLSALVLALFAVVVFLCRAQPPAWTLMVAAASLSTLRVFFMPARGAAVPALVPADKLLEANSLSATTQNVMPLISLSLSAGVLAVLYKISPTWFFLSSVLLNLLSFLGSAHYVAKLPAIRPDREKVEDVHPLQDLKDGLKFVRGRHELWVMLGLQLLLNLMISPFFVVYLAANKAWFGGLPQNLAWLEFSFFAGLVAGSLLVGRLKITRPGLGYVISMAGVGVSVAGMGLTPTFSMIFVWNVMAGLLIPFGSIPVSTYLQITVPDEYRGRVNSAWTTVSVGIQPVGLVLGGKMVEVAGLIWSFMIMGGGMAVAGLLGLLDRDFRHLRMPEPAQRGREEPVDGALFAEPAG